MMPVDGILSDDESQLKFRWKSLKTIYSLMFLFCGTVESCLGTRRLLRLGFSINYVEGLVFFILAAVRAYIFFFLARKWSEIMKMWKKCEIVFLHEPYKVTGWSLSLKLRLVFCIMAIFVISKKFSNFFSILKFQLFSWAFVFSGHSNERQLHATDLLHSKVTKFLGKLSLSISTSFRTSFSLQPFSASFVRGKLLLISLLNSISIESFQWVNVLQQFSSNYGDIFVILLAIGVNFRFNQINDYFRHILKNENLMTQATFRELRINYFQLIDLVYFVDSKVSMLILLSLGHNMLVLMVNIFNAFK